MYFLFCFLFTSPYSLIFFRLENRAYSVIELGTETEIAVVCRKLSSVARDRCTAPQPVKLGSPPDKNGLQQCAYMDKSAKIPNVHPEVTNSLTICNCTDEEPCRRR